VLGPLTLSQTTLFIFCTGNELFFICLYLMNSYHKPIGISAPYLMSCLPVVLQRSVPLSIWAALQRLTWPQLIAGLSFPICAGKQIINCVQFWKASKHLVDSDLEDRYQKKLARSSQKSK
jgi:CDP-diacylglycerol--inositol 3-phosphatidyltransferase